jgi:hypothetical protein
MTLREHEQQRPRHALRKHQKQQKRQRQRRQQLLPLPAVLHDDLVLDFSQWCALNDVSIRTGRRILANGGGPEVTQLSKHRIGVRVKANRVWQASRARG